MHRNRWGVCVFALWSALYGAAGAQGNAAVDTSAGLERTVQLSPQEQLVQGDMFIARMSASGATVRRLLESARAQRDVVKTLCLNDKLNQIDVAVRSGQERRGSLELAARRNDADLANHEFTILQVLKQRVEQLQSESRQCIGEELQFTGDSSVTATVAPNIPGPEIMAYPEPELITVFLPPQCASCIW